MKASKHIRSLDTRVRPSQRREIAINSNLANRSFKVPCTSGPASIVALVLLCRKWDPLKPLHPRTRTQQFLTSDHRIVRIYQLDALALDVEDVVEEHVVAQPSVVNLDLLGSGVQVDTG